MNGFEIGDIVFYPDHESGSIGISTIKSMYRDERGISYETEEDIVHLVEENVYATPQEAYETYVDHKKRFPLRAFK